MRRSVAISTNVHDAAIDHLIRADGQEDLTFALYESSAGRERTTRILTELVLPEADERRVHGNASFYGSYFLRASKLAGARDMGLALIHSHPRGTGWQGMSHDDVEAESSLGVQTLTFTGRPLLGMTLAGADSSWAGREWIEEGQAVKMVDCESVRVVGDQMHFSFPTRLKRKPNPKIIRTESVWGDHIQGLLEQIRIGVIGLGSVGSIVTETLARSGAGNLVLIDFDSIEEHNLDRTAGATSEDLRLARGKAESARKNALRCATYPDIRVDVVDASVAESSGWQTALDCDILFSCVDRPWPRQLLNLAAYGHLIPVIDGGIKATRNSNGEMASAGWNVQTVGPGRKCLQCLGQFDPGAVQAERLGQLDDPAYIEGLPPDHLLRSRSNVFAFSGSVASLEVLQMISMLAAPGHIADLGSQIYHVSTGKMDHDYGDCLPGCRYSSDLLGVGDKAPVDVRHHAAASDERSSRRTRQRRPLTALRRWLAR
ncbi:MAG: ThiF family adenylyltransferase [Thermoleophilia bacterium]|nr:ThiF family adenylyltransferase [Thermoleophilia bacterium]